MDPALERLRGKNYEFKEEKTLSFQGIGVRPSVSLRSTVLIASLQVLGFFWPDHTTVKLDIASKRSQTQKMRSGLVMNHNGEPSEFSHKTL